MNNSPSPTIKIQVVPDPNPWESKESLPHFPIPAILVLSFAVLCGALYPALARTFPFLWAPACIVCMLCLVRVVRGLVPKLGISLLFVAGLILRSPSLGAILVGILTAISLMALLITLTRSPWLLALPIAAYVLAWILCGSYVTALLTLLPFPAAAALAYGTMKNDGRVSVICSTAGALVVSALVALSVYWLRLGNDLTLSSVVTLFDDVRQGVAALVAASPDTPEINAMMQQAGYPYTIEELLDLLISLCMPISPAILIGCCSIVAYLAQLLCVRSYAGCGAPQLMTRSAQLFVLSVPSALIYLFCFFVSLFLKQSSVFSAVLLNLQLILLPGMCIAGAWKLYADYRRRPSTLMLVLLGISLLVASPMLIICISLSGAFTTLLRPLIARMIAGGFDPNGGNDHHS